MVSKSMLWENIESYADQATVHGVGYIFQKKLGLTDRLLWLFIVLLSMTLAIWMVNTSYTDWKDHPVITTLKTTTKPVTDLNFPAITVCADGKTLELVKKAIYKRFLKWKQSQPKELEIEEDLKRFMREVFQIKEENTKIMDILDTMISPKAAAAKAVSKNERACATNKERVKRSPISEALCKYKSNQKLL